jgi:hypothetical protein
MDYGSVPKYTDLSIISLSIMIKLGKKKARTKVIHKNISHGY